MSMSALQAQLKTGVANVTKAKSNFDAKVSSSAPSRPTKRKAEAIELSDSDDEMAVVPKVKRQQPVATTSYSAPVKKTVKPWDQDYSRKKLATNGPVATTSTATTKSSHKKADLVSLSSQQNKILEVVEEGKSVFFTGSAGTGKSVLLRAIIKSLRQKHIKNNDAVAVTASTGIAACNIGGVTLHSFGGVGLAQESAVDLATKIKRNQKASTRWMRTKVLIIDESKL